MRPRKHFLYFLTDPQGRSYFRNGFGTMGRPNISKESLPRQLDSSPIGWMDNALSVIRSQNYFGINTSLSIPLTFVDDGADIIRNRLYSMGYGDKINLNINKWNGDTSDVYDPYYNGELDLTEEKDKTAGVTVNAIQGGALKYLNANQEVPYDIPCDETNPDAIKVLFDGVTLADKFNYTATDIFIQNNNYAIPVAFISNEGDNVDVVGATQSYDIIPGLPTDYVATSANYFFKAFAATTLKGMVKLRIENLELVPTTCLVYMMRNDGTSFTLFNGEIPAASVYGIPYQFSLDVDVTIPLGADQSVFFLFQQEFELNMTNFKDTTFSMNFNSKKAPSTAFGIRASSVLKQLVYKMTDGKYTASGPIFDEIDDIVYTCGDALRNSNRAIVPNYFVTLSYKDFFKDMNAEYMLATSVVNNVIILSRRQAVFDYSSVTMDVGEVSDHEVSVWKEMLVNSIKSGYTDQKYDQRSGKYEFNSTAFRKMPVSVINKEYDITAKSRADWLGIEILRSSFTNLDSTDNAGDKNSFMVAVSHDQDVDGNYLLLRPNYSSITGVIDNTVFNTTLSPTRQALAHGSWLRSLTYFSPISRINFQSALKNSQLSTTLDGVTITENANIRVDTLPAPLFYPYVFTFKTRVPKNFIDVMTGAVNGHIAFTINGRQFYGYPLEVSVKPALNEEQTWKVLASPMNDILQLQNLEPDPFNTLNMLTYGLEVAYLCPVQFIPIGEIISTQHHYKEMNSAFYIDQIQEYTERKNYFQKWQNDDTIALQCFTNGLGPVQVDVIDCKGRNYLTVPLAQKIDSAVSPPYAIFEATVALNTLPPGKIYYMILTAGTGSTIAQYISEGLSIKADWPLTLLYKYKATQNRLNTIFSTGYFPTMRAEGTIMNFLPGAKYTEYEDDPLDFEIIEGIPYRKFELKIGVKTLIPPYIVDKINRILSLNYSTADGFRITRAAEEFQVTRVDGRGDAFWSLLIRQATNRNSSTLTVDGQLNKSIAVFYNIETKFFGDFSGQVSSNIVQVERVEEQ